MNKNIIILVLVIECGILGYYKLHGGTTDLSPYIKQISDMSTVVKNLQSRCK